MTSYFNTFISLPVKNKEIEKIKEQYISKKYDKVLEVFFIKRIDDITKIFPIIYDNSILSEKIIHNYWSIVNLYFIQVAQKKPRCKKTIIDFFNSTLRILEFALIVKHQNLIELEKIFFDINTENNCFFKHFISIKEDIFNDHSNIIKIEKDPKNKNRITVFVSEYFKYIPISIPKMQKKDKLNFDVFWFNKYFKLDDVLVKEMFEGNGSSISGTMYSKRRGIKGKEGTLQTHQSLDSLTFSDIDIESVNTFEEKIELLQKDNQIASIVFEKENKFIKKIEIIGNKINSSFKQYLINKTISNGIAKNEMYLISKAPNLELFSILVKVIIKDNGNYYNSLILISLFTGIDIKNLLYLFLEQSQDIKYLSNYGILRVKIKDGIFANTIQVNPEITKKVRNNEFNIQLPFFLQKLCNYSKEKIKDSFNIFKNENKYIQYQWENFINLELKSLSKVLVKNKIALDKNTLHVNIRTIHKLFYHYFHILNDKTDIGILFSNTLSKNNQAKVCYLISPKRLINFEKWINDFYEILTQNYSSTKFFDGTNIEFIGSPKFIESFVFKNFLLDLKKLDGSSKIQRFNISMIYIRYSLSISLATRSSYNSCNLSNYSQKLSLLTIHEKAKSIKSSKRLIPLTSKAMEFIKLFLDLKKEFNISSFAPILIEEKEDKLIEIELSKESILNFLEKFCEKELFINLKKFIKSTDLNLGRHIFTTKAVVGGFNREYTDEFMGHFSKAKLGFGHFSNFNIQKYIKETKDFIEIIEKEYFLEEKIDTKSFK